MGIRTWLTAQVQDRYVMFTADQQVEGFTTKNQLFLYK